MLQPLLFFFAKKTYSFMKNKFEGGLLYGTVIDSIGKTV